MAKKPVNQKKEKQKKEEISGDGKIEQGESELEEQIEEIEKKIEGARFEEPVSSRPVFAQLQGSAPVLDPVETSIQTPDTTSPITLEEDAGSVSVGDLGKKKEDDDITKYVSNIPSEQSAGTYQTQQTEAPLWDPHVRTPARVAIERVGREQITPIRTGMSVAEARDARTAPVSSEVKYTARAPERVESEELGKGDLFEKPEVKYKPSY